MRNICLVFLALMVSVCGFADEAEDRRKIYLYLEGRSIFLEQCSPCHGRLGKGDGEWAQDWTKNRPRNFRTGIFKFRTTPMGKLPTDEDLKRTISSGISGTAMPTFKGHLRDSQYEAVIEYLKHLSKRWKDPKNVEPAVVLPDAPDWMKSFAESKPHQARGKVLFTTVCASCHGPSGKGDGEAGKDIDGCVGIPNCSGRSHSKAF